MYTKISKTSSIPSNEAVVFLGKRNNAFKGLGLTAQELSFVKTEIKKNEKLSVQINQYKRYVYVQVLDSKKKGYQLMESCRRAGNDLLASINGGKHKKVTIVDLENDGIAVLALVEGMVLGNYKFLKYRSEAKKEVPALNTIKVHSKSVSQKNIDHLNASCEGNLLARTLVNEPLSYLTATQLSKEIQKMGVEAGFKVEVLNKRKIEALKMGGLLAVNRGSLDPPTFTIMEWKPRGFKNKKPYVLVGKGVVYDTGGLSLKPTPKSMEFMKCDMGGAAAVAGTIYTIAKAKLPVHVVGLIPATDNRPSGNAYTPGDIITMHDKSTVEVLNTDAEGRLILGDALSYAKKYKPELVIDLATLTGSAIISIGQYGIVSMHNDADKQHNKLTESGNKVYERLAEMPFWEEYGELIKSQIADIKNLGGPSGGAITAGKFLHHFTDYPWIHLDIAGPAFLDAPDNYRGIGGTGIGVRLLFDYFKNLS